MDGRLVVDQVLAGSIPVDYPGWSRTPLERRLLCPSSEAGSIPAGIVCPVGVTGERVGLKSRRARFDSGMGHQEREMPVRVRLGCASKEEADGAARTAHPRFSSGCALGRRDALQATRGGFNSHAVHCRRRPIGRARAW